MLKALVLRVAVLAIALLVVDAVMDTVHVTGGFFGALGLAVVYGLVSAIVGTVLRALTFPLILITAGLFEIVINVVLLLVVEWLTDWIELDGFMTALGASLILSAVSIVLGFVIAAVVPESRRS